MLAYLAIGDTLGKKADGGRRSKTIWEIPGLGNFGLGMISDGIVSVSGCANAMG